MLAFWVDFTLAKCSKNRGSGDFLPKFVGTIPPKLSPDVYCESAILRRSLQVQFERPTMFLRVIRAPSGKTGVKQGYVLVEAYRDREGKTRHQTIINLGRKDLLAAHLNLDKLNRLLHGGPAADQKLVTHDDVGAIGAWDWARRSSPLARARSGNDHRQAFRARSQ
jgi:hypothetical protein